MSGADVRVQLYGLADRLEHDRGDVELIANHVRQFQMNVDDAMARAALTVLVLKLERTRRPDHAAKHLRRAARAAGGGR